MAHDRLCLSGLFCASVKQRANPTLSQRPLVLSGQPLERQLRCQLWQLGIRTVEQLTALPLVALQGRFGPRTPRFYYLAEGVEASPIQPIIRRIV